MKKFLTVLASAAVLAMPLAVISTPVAAQTGGAVTPAAPAAAPAEKAAPAASKGTAKAKKAKKGKRASKAKATAPAA